MPNNDWIITPLGDLTENFDSIRVPVKGSERRQGSYPYYGASGVVDHVDDFLFDGDYLLIAEDGENLRSRQTPIAFMANGKFWVNNHAHIVRGNSKADTRFLMYALSIADVSGYLTGSTMPKLTQGNLNRIPVLAPSLVEQKVIVRILGSLDDKIEVNRQMNKTLEATARAVFRSWFIDFDESQGSIPADWRLGTINDLITLNRASVKPSDYPDEVFDHYSIPAFDEGRLPKAERGATIMSNKSVVQSDSILLSKLNPDTPRVWLPSLNPERRSICSTEFLVATPRKGYSREYVLSLFTSDFFTSNFATFVTGTSGSHQRVKQDALLSMTAVIPSEAAVNRFTELVRPVFRLMQDNIAESNILADIRDALLPRLLSGELTVGDTDNILSRAA